MKHILSVLVILGLFTGCTEDFAEINTNPNGPVTVQPDLLFRQVIYGFGNDMGREGFAGGALLSQHFAMTDFNLFDRHALSSPQEGGDPWPILYTALRDNETVLEISRANPTAAAYEGPALVMKAYLAMNLTDIFGDVPYFEAFSARTNQVTKPAYDAQERIYTEAGGILDNLTTAVEVMDADAGSFPLGGDLLFGGDLEGWIRFANSLRIKALIRISARRAPGQELQDIVNDGRFIKNGTQDATFDFAASPPNSFPIAEERAGIFNVFLMSRTAERVYNALNDPRTGTIYRSTQPFLGFAGIQNGIIGGAAVPVDTFARPGLVWRENSQDLDFNYLTAWETDFLLAEAVLKGFVNDTDGSAERYYNGGIRKAFAYWLTDLPESYVSTGPAAYDPDRALEQIITQKWIASTANVYEGWNEWRRTGFPALLPVAESLNNNMIPVRMPYPSEEQALNFENYSSAAAATDDNSINTKVWWDGE
ncbi:SusD/RagB family nutrient-binding outer membrane lipoprotein [Neolewinella antarctica]|uniref:SusD/RagB family nutrient-binding outer membrane lipoprotein n=1 Tax=Neolewinella antarctica TaxID=442734 RepID=A0ABX0XC11_9BACT|nr:SusD/RagB family nutrient-binding outer membrane lipoprotein [Neolewinella antarctica]NJC26373.1 hypothetical protein [Neolewinella antarctica]